MSYPINSNHSGKYHKSYDVAPGVLLVSFARAPVNAFHEPMWREMSKIFHQLRFDPSVRVIVLASESEKIWTAGLDVLHEHIRDFQSAISSIEEATQPVIAAISGLCLGLGIDIASACDIRLVSDQASMGILEVNVGLAADIGTLQRFPKITGSSSLARELAMTGRRFSPTEATAIGFTSRVVPGGRSGVVEEAISVAKVIAGKSPVAVTSTKRLMIHARDHSVQEGLDYTAAWNMSMLQSEIPNDYPLQDTPKAMQGAMQKREPKFDDLPRLPLPQWDALEKAKKEIRSAKL
ncbi:hypothetical protein QFC20_001120 [Naganishia adeliensis]|uniref:Uncharacterized protein n=1 Tax=Naganishia adeliensis TaxID=92952 RepID=A0ACC2WU16_9TREE|nr:hypothetical protein QFC20_001120 [Naganishia adeliensis]